METKAKPDPTQLPDGTRSYSKDPDARKEVKLMANELNETPQLPQELPQELPSSVELPQVAGNHKPNCPCRLCERVRARRAAGLPTSAEEKAAKRAAAEARREAKRAKKRKSNATVAAVQASLATQVRLGHRPNAGLAGESAGVSARQGQMIAEANNFVQQALSSVGITDSKLAEVAAAGLEAAMQKIITDRDGRIVDVVNTPDWRNRHAFWSDLLRIKKILGADTETGGGSGGLIIITNDAAKVLPGHPPACTCDSCKIAWEEKYAHLRRAAVRDSTIRDAEIARAQLTDPRAKNAIDTDVIDVDAEEEDAVEYDDFGPVG